MLVEINYSKIIWSDGHMLVEYQPLVGPLVLLFKRFSLQQKPVSHRWAVSTSRQHISASRLSSLTFTDRLAFVTPRFTLIFFFISNLKNHPELACSHFSCHIIKNIYIHLTNSDPQITYSTSIMCFAVSVIWFCCNESVYIFYLFEILLYKGGNWGVLSNSVVIYVCVCW